MFGQVSECCFGPSAMRLELLILQVFPYFFIRVPVRRVFGQVEQVQTLLTGDVPSGLLRNVGRRLVHYDYQLSVLVMTKYLVQKMDALRRGDAPVVQGEQ